MKIIGGGGAKEEYPYIFGEYGLTRHLTNERSRYVKLNDRKVNIWYCGTYWFIGHKKILGECQGWASNNVQRGKCPAGWAGWDFYKKSWDRWILAGEDLIVYCLEN